MRQTIVCSRLIFNVCRRKSSHICQNYGFSIVTQQTGKMFFMSYTRKSLDKAHTQQKHKLGKIFLTLCGATSGVLALLVYHPWDENYKAKTWEGFGAKSYFLIALLFAPIQINF